MVTVPSLAVGMLSSAELALPVAVRVTRERDILVLSTCRQRTKQKRGINKRKHIYLVLTEVQ